MTAVITMLGLTAFILQHQLAENQGIVDTTVTPQEAAARNAFGQKVAAAKSRKALRGLIRKNLDLGNESGRDPDVVLLEVDDRSKLAGATVVPLAKETVGDTGAVPTLNSALSKQDSNGGMTASNIEDDSLESAATSSRRKAEPSGSQLTLPPLFPRREANATMLESVKESIAHAWNSYKKYAWGRDNLKPMSKSGDDRFLGAHSSDTSSISL
jgi:hypothetical protein